MPKSIRAQHRNTACTLAATLAFSLAAPHAYSQAAPGGGGNKTGSTSDPSIANSNAISTGQTQLSNATGSNGANVTQDSYKGSIVTGKNTGTVIDLTLDDAIARGLRQNLGPILQQSAVQSANGSRLEQLQALLPTITAGSSIEVEQVNLAAFGLKFPGVKPIIGPFQVVDFRAYLTQNVVNIAALQSYIAAKHNFAAAKLTAEDARDLVVLTVGNAYLLCIADPARIDRRPVRTEDFQGHARPGHRRPRRRHQSPPRRPPRPGRLPERAADPHLHHQPARQG